MGRIAIPRKNKPAAIRSRVPSLMLKTFAKNKASAMYPHTVFAIVIIFYPFYLLILLPREITLLTQFWNYVRRHTHIASG